MGHSPEKKKVVMHFTPQVLPPFSSAVFRIFQWFKIFFLKKYIKIIFFYFLKIIFNIKTIKNHKKISF
jgi:hypothetical protein